MWAGKSITARDPPTNNQNDNDHQFSIPDDLQFDDILAKIHRNKKQIITSVENLKLYNMTEEN